MDRGLLPWTCIKVSDSFSLENTWLRPGGPKHYGLQDLPASHHIWTENVLHFFMSWPDFVVKGQGDCSREWGIGLGIMVGRRKAAIRSSLKRTFLLIQCFKVSVDFLFHQATLGDSAYSLLCVGHCYATSLVFIYRICWKAIIPTLHHQEQVQQIKKMEKLTIELQKMNCELENSHVYWTIAPTAFGEKLVIMPTFL